MCLKSNFTIPALAAISFGLIGGTTPTYADLGDQLAKLQADDGAAKDWFGRSVAINGATAIVGADRHDDNGSSSGSAYLFDISDPTNPTQLFKLLADDGAAFDRFGTSVAISGATAIVGAHNDDDNGENSGSAYLFDSNTGQQLFKLLPNDGTESDQFGFSVAISGDIAIVGARRTGFNGPSSGSADLFDSNTGQQLFKLLADGGGFGGSVAISGATAIVGARTHDANGSAYLFDAVPNTCPWDLDNTGTVGVKDLLFLLGAWGPCPPKGDCPADFDNSGDVGVKDLLVLLGNWGPCP